MSDSRASRASDIGLLVLRVGIGLMFVGHGWPKLAGGPEKWTKLGGAMKTFGIEFAPMMWGGLAAAAETFGGILIAIGLFYRPALVSLVATMMVATAMHFDRGDGFGGASHAIESAIVFGALLIIGPGKYAIRWRPTFGGYDGGQEARSQKAT